MVPIRPESTDQLRARYAAAVTDLVDHAVFRANNMPRLGGVPRHVFDLHNGLRLIISRDRIGPGITGIHLSASVHEGSALDESIRVGQTSPMAFFQMAIRALRLISADATIQTRLGLVQWSPDKGKGVPHFFFLDAAAPAREADLG